MQLNAHNRSENVFVLLLKQIIHFEYLIIIIKEVPTVELQTRPTVRLATTWTSSTLQNSGNENIGALAGVTSVAALYSIISVIVILT